MPINSLSDIRKSWGETWADASDEEVLRAYAKAVNMDPTDVANRLGYVPSGGSLTGQSNTLTDSAYQGNTDRLPALPSALFESLGATVLIAVVGWVVYKKYVQKSLAAKTPVRTGQLWAAGAALLTLSVIPHQFSTKDFVGGLVATLTLLLMYSAVGFCLGWAYRTVRPAKPRTNVKQHPNRAPGGSDSILLKVPVLAPLNMPLAQSGQAIKPPTEEDHWATALAELDEGKRRPGVWAKAFADSDGDEVRAKVAYLKTRMQQLTSAVGGS